MQLSESAAHLAITRTGKQEPAINVNDRIRLARRTSYSLMNTGLHVVNGLSPETPMSSIEHTCNRVYFMGLRY